MKTIITLLLLLVCVNVIAPTQTKVLVESIQGISGFSGVAAKANGDLVFAANPKNLRTFNTVTKLFTSSFTYPGYSFIDDVAVVTVGGVEVAVAGSAFLDGSVPSLLNNGTLIQSNSVVNETTPNMGQYVVKFNPNLLGLNPITNRNGTLYVGTSFNPFVLYRMDWKGSVPVRIDLDDIVANNAFAFNAQGELFAPDLNFADYNNSRIVKIVIDNVNNVGHVTTVVSGISYPVAVKVKSNGHLYIASRILGTVYKYDFTTLTPLATFEPPLDNLCFSPDETKLYVTNNNNGLFQYNLLTGTTQVIYKSPITFPWDIKYDSERKSIFVADTTGIKEYKASNGNLVRSLVFDSLQAGGAFVSSGNANGLTVECGPDALLIVTDGTQGNLLGIYKKNFTLAFIYNSFAFNTGLAFKQPYSTVRVVDDDEILPPYYLSATLVDGNIVKIYEQSGVITNKIFCSGLLGPVKLVLRGDYVYVVEGGDLLNLSNNTGRISRILLSNSSVIEHLVTGLNDPQGLDFHESDMYFVEAGNKRVMKAKAHQPSSPTRIYDGLDLGLVRVISQFNPYPVYPFAGLTVKDNGKKLWVSQYGTMVGILEIKL